MVEFTAKHFDEIILDDFYFTNCKCDLMYSRQRRQKLDPVSHGADGRSLERPYHRSGQGGQPEGKSYYQISELVRKFSGAGLRFGGAAKAFRCNLHRHRNPQRRERPAAAILPELSANSVFQQHKARRQPGRLD